MKNSQRDIACVFLVLVLAVGCVSASRPTDSSSDNSITAEELTRSNSQNVYDALEKLRPNWLTSRGVTSIRDPEPPRPNVYMNGTRVGDLEYLRQVNVMQVGSLRFWTAAEASARFGMGNPRGVIEIIPR